MPPATMLLLKQNPFHEPIELPQDWEFQTLDGNWGLEWIERKRKGRRVNISPLLKSRNASRKLAHPELELGQSISQFLASFRNRG